MPDTACLKFQYALTEALAAAKPIDIGLEHARHVVNCDSCHSWLDRQEIVQRGTSEAEIITRLEPLIAAFDSIERGTSVAPPAV